MNQRRKRVFLFIYIMKESRTLRNGLLQYMKEGFLCFVYLLFDINSLITFCIAVFAFRVGVAQCRDAVFLVLF